MTDTLALIKPAVVLEEYEERPVYDAEQEEENIVNELETELLDDIELHEHDEG